MSALRFAVTTAARTMPATAVRSVQAPAVRMTYARAMSMYYAESHEYIKVDGDVGTMGITAHAADALGDIVFVDLPDVGSEFDQGESFGSVESVKAASDVYAPVAGEIVEVNEELDDNPGVVNESADGEGWFAKIKISDASQLDGLMGEEAYAEFCANEEH
eukprot:CAMPEP_0205921498 /NCGR_PEP_ID=MMETSP1325-20131115/12898_1 /ASSEMBLY_ACC=CAM_ASM_000708 /TAXON_ID=236786 /ORGANISM="Florenciella sp., Strain RCC1007" /LENGTH=160 /DNA_ID=CAMNT_0053289331 /DNA_START=15 /DNA_END=497 /DNA_ORIENTATION=+